MRQLCNVTYSLVTEGMTQQEQKDLDRKLEADDPAAVSRGTDALLALMGGPRVPRGG